MYGPDLLNDPKMHMLPLAHFKTTVLLWCLRSQQGGPFRADQVAFALRLPEQEASEHLAALTTAGLLVHLQDGSIEPHNWSARQYVSDVSKERVRKHRASKKRQRNVTRNNGVTAPEAETDSESDPEAHSQASARKIDDQFRFIIEANPDRERVARHLLEPIVRQRRFDAPDPAYTLGQLADAFLAHDFDDAAMADVVASVIRARGAVVKASDIEQAVAAIVRVRDAAKAASANAATRRVAALPPAEKREESKEVFESDDEDPQRRHVFEAAVRGDSIEKVLRLRGYVLRTAAEAAAILAREDAAEIPAFGGTR